MACACNGGPAAKKYQYTSPDGKNDKTYNTEIEAKAAKVRFQGGDYTPVAAN